MSKTIEAVYENGVFKPLKKMTLKEHERVHIKILPNDEWQKRFDHLIEKIHKKAAQYNAEEIESDISQTIKEVKKEKYGH